MRKLLALIVALCALAGCARAENAAWLAYWDVDGGLDEAFAHLDSLDELICFEAFFDEFGEWAIPKETEDMLEALRGCGARVYLSLVNDVQTKDGGVTQKSKDLLLQLMADEDSRTMHVEQVLELVEDYGLEGVEIDYENIKQDSDLWYNYTLFIDQLYGRLNERGVNLRVVMECQAPLYAVFPEGPEYSCMCYNLYGYHSGPGPKADRTFLENTGARWLDMPGEPRMAFATGGFLWNGGEVTRALREQDAKELLESAGVEAQRDPESMALTAEIPGDDGGTLWFADGETLCFWRDVLEAMGYKHFELFRLSGNEDGSLTQFLR